MGLLQRIKDQGRVTDQGRMVEEKQDGLDWCLGEQGQPGYRCLGPSTVIVLFYAVGCIVFGFLVSLVVMQMDKSKAKKRKRSMDQNGANIESKVDAKTRTLEEATDAFERSEQDGKFTGKKDEMRTRKMSNVSRDSRRGSTFMAGSRRGSTASASKSVPASPLVGRNIPPSPLEEGDKES